MNHTLVPSLLAVLVLLSACAHSPSASKPGTAQTSGASEQPKVQTASAIDAGKGTMTITPEVQTSPGFEARPLTFADDVAFLKKHRETIVLASADGKAKVAVVPSICGRVFTSTAEGDLGPGYGAINRELIASGKIAPKINGYGGEDRFWLGPEGGQFAIFFKPRTKFTLDDWQTPAPIDTEAYRVVGQSERSITMEHEATFTNWSGNTLACRISRKVELLGPDAVTAAIRVSPGGASCVAFRTVNAITNTGTNAWTKQSGMLSIWTLGMFKPSARTTVVVPFVPGSEVELGTIVKDDYFGKVPAKRLLVGGKAVFFRGDGAMRTKIGIPARRTKPLIGSWNPDQGVLTLVAFSFNPSAKDYVNSMWEMQKNPYAGDVVNSYNDGGAPWGSFYELETSSPALALKPGESGEHTSTTMHFSGTLEALDRIARETLGVSLQDIERALPKAQ
jgi:hypothetical protein